mmetsp:Transcript_32504/g.62458  ORF Transcript_32504/g.62458 Transcript_32504/m.62458 type:complete len:202 (+) Transcript_32504:242-847(+)
MKRYRRLPVYVEASLVVLSSKRLLETSNGLSNILTMPKCAHPNKALPRNAKTGTRCGDNVSLLKNLRKRIPGWFSIHRNPHVGCICASVGGEAQVIEALLQHGGILLVVSHQLPHGGHASLGGACKPARLRHVGCAVEAGGHDAVPVGAHRSTVRKLERVRHHRPPEAHAGEARELGEGARLQRHLLRPRNLEDAARAVRV